MKREIIAEPDLEALPETGGGNRGNSGPRVLDVADLLGLDTPAPSMLVENWLPERGASLIVGAAKANKTLIAVQIGIAVASGNPFLENYRILRLGPVLIVEQDDPAGAASIKEVLKCSQVPVEGIPFHLVKRVPFNFGLELLEWLELQILKLHLRLVVLDSYTSLRSSRVSGGDIVKSEQNDLTLLDDLANRTGCAVSIIHHASKVSGVGLQRPGCRHLRDECGDSVTDPCFKIQGTRGQCARAASADPRPPPGRTRNGSSVPQGYAGPRVCPGGRSCGTLSAPATDSGRPWLPDIRAEGTIARHGRESGHRRSPDRAALPGRGAPQTKLRKLLAHGGAVDELPGALSVGKSD